MAELGSQPKTIQTLYSWYRDGNLFVNRSYQRKLVWTLEEKQKLIDSLLSNYPIPAIILSESANKPEQFEIIDGLQRLHAIMSFIETAFPDERGKYFDLDGFPTARSNMQDGKFSDNAGSDKLSSAEITRILDYSLATAIMRHATTPEVNDVFDRINTFGHRLSNQERRQAGVDNEFSNAVREVATSLRGDVSDNTLPLYQMPSVSIDMPMTRHGYEVKAEEVFWVKHGIILAGDLRDSQDEECIADILASMALGSPVDRSRRALDRLYDSHTDEGQKLSSAFTAKGREQLVDEFKYIIEAIERFSSAGSFSPLKRRMFKKAQGNAFPTIFSTVFLALYERLVAERKRVTDFSELAKHLNNVGDRLDAGKKGASPEKRRENVNLVKGLIETCLIPDESVVEIIYQNHGIVDIEDAIKRSQVELSNYELKSGLLDIAPDAIDASKMINKILKTICAMANNGPGRAGKILLGVCDTQDDAARVKAVDDIEPKDVGSRFIVGVHREANRMGVSIEDYIHILRDGISNSTLSSPLKETVLSDIDFNNFLGLGVIVITVRSPNEPSYFDDKVFYRRFDQTVQAEGPKQAIDIAARFK